MTPPSAPSSASTGARRTPRSDGWSGYQVVQLLEAAHASLAHDGASIACASPLPIPADAVGVNGARDVRTLPELRPGGQALRIVVPKDEMLADTGAD